VPRDGYFVRPKLFGPVPRSNSLARDEVFGPVLSVIPFESEEDAIHLANGTDFGLIAGVWTENAKTRHPCRAQGQGRAGLYQRVWSGGRH
jgi:aldehyde dehydrogenase (NAD+)